MPESFKRNPEEEKWKEVTQWRTENKDWLELSFSIALCVVDEMERTGITQKELAKRMQVSPQQVSKILKGSENLTLETICKLNSVLGIQLIRLHLLKTLPVKICLNTLLRLQNSEMCLLMSRWECIISH